MTTKKRTRAARKREAACSASMWAVMKARSWESLEVMGLSLRAPKDGPCKFIPLFETRAQAVAFDGGCEDHVREVQPNPMPRRTRMRSCMSAQTEASSLPAPPGPNGE